MQYGLTRLILEEKHFIEVAADYYHAALAARRNLDVVLAVEEKVTLVLENYVEFENELITAVQREIVFEFDGWSAFVSQLYSFSRRLMNLLTAVRTYLDQIQHDLSLLYGPGSTQAASIKNQSNIQYNSLLGYRVMEALRNYVQHRGLPIYNTEYWGSWDIDPSGRTAVNTVTPRLSVEQLREDGGFKKSVLMELERQGTLIDVKPLVREYMDGIGHIHQHFRKTVGPDVEYWDGVVTGAINRYKAVGGDNVIGLALVARDSGGVVKSKTFSENGIERRKWLQRRTHSLTHFSKQIVTSAVREHLASLPHRTNLHD